MAVAKTWDNEKISEKSRPRPARAWLALTGLLFGLLYLPLLVLVFYSFIDPAQPGQWTFRWYRQLAQDSQLMEALGVSLWVGLWSTLFAAVLGTGIALALERRNFAGKKSLEMINLVPLVMPEIVLGLSLLVWFGLIQKAFAVLGIEFGLGSLSLIISHITFCLAYVVITVQTRLQDFDRSLEEAALDLGATPWMSFWKVTFPLIWPGILSGSLLAFTISFDDFIVSYFTAGVGSDPLPVKLYSMIRFGMSPAINAISSLILAVTILLVLLSFRPKRSRRH
jgi:spermidine/putrescine transport system permease protein